MGTKAATRDTLNPDFLGIFRPVGGIATPTQSPPRLAEPLSGYATSFSRERFTAQDPEAKGSPAFVNEMPGAF